MANVMTNSSICYSGYPLGLSVHGIIGGVGELRTAAPTAKKPFYYKRISAEYYYRFSRGKQDKMTWPGTDPLGLRLPGYKQIALVAAVLAWQLLPEEEKQEWRDLATRLRRWGGYQLFISRSLKGEI
jgi:hypothetical protein